LGDSRSEQPDGRRARASGSAAYPAMLRALCTARDRYLAHARARRLAYDGRIVICDRYPMPEYLRMDGPETCSASPGRSANRLTTRLARAEEGYYRSIAPADL